MTDQEVVSYTDEGDTDHVITTGWSIFDGECQDVMDAPTRGKALFGSFLWQEAHDGSRWTSLKGFSVRRRKDIDGLTFADARYVIWPCKQRPCPGCPCCEEGLCSDDDDD